jgi:hypothetical protein
MLVKLKLKLSSLKLAVSAAKLNPRDIGGRRCSYYPEKWFEMTYSLRSQYQMGVP